MGNIKLIYWVSTSIISIFLSLSAYSYIFSKSNIDGFRDLGFPDHFRWQLIILKLIAAVVLLLPIVPIQIKEWAYAGVGLFLITAMVAHFAHKDHWSLQIILIILFGILVLSNMYLHKLPS